MVLLITTYNRYGYYALLLPGCLREVWMRGGKDSWTDWELWSKHLDFVEQLNDDAFRKAHNLNATVLLTFSY